MRDRVARSPPTPVPTIDSALARPKKKCVALSYSVGFTERDRSHIRNTYFFLLFLARFEAKRRKSSVRRGALIERKGDTCAARWRNRVLRHRTSSPPTDQNPAVLQAETEWRVPIAKLARCERFTPLFSSALKKGRETHWRTYYDRKVVRNVLPVEYKRNFPRIRTFLKIYFDCSAESLPISTQNDQRCSSAFMTSRKGLSSGPIKWPVTAPFLPLHPITSVHRGMFFQPWECKLDKRLRTENSVDGVTNAGSSSANVLACKSNLSRNLP